MQFYLRMISLYVAIVACTADYADNVNPMLSYTPLSDEALEDGQLKYYDDIEKKTFSSDVANARLKVHVPKKARAYDVVPVEYELSKPAYYPQWVAIEAVAYESKTKVAAKSLYSLNLPGNLKVKIEYLGSIGADYEPLKWKMHEIPKTGITPLIYPIYMDDSEAFDKIKWFASQHLKAVEHMPEILKPILDKLKVYGPVCIQWNLQPFELFGLASVDNLVVMAKLYPQVYRDTCDLIRDVNIELLKAVIGSGADFVFLGGPGVEMMSPDLYENYIIPDSQKLSAAIHAAGGLIYSYICSPIEPFLTKGFYNQMGIDLFETLSPPPVGNVDNLEKARNVLVSNICTRGNIGLDVLLEGSQTDVEAATVEVLKATEGSKHMVAASDYLFYDIPLENVKAVVKTVESYK
jgi:hypothetical protein